MQLRCIAWVFVGASVVARDGMLLAASEGPPTMPTLTGSGVMSSLVAAAAASGGKGQWKVSALFSSEWSIFKWRRKSWKAKSRTPWFIPPELMCLPREEDREGEEAEKRGIDGYAATALSREDADEGLEDATTTSQLEEEVETATPAGVVSHTEASILEVSSSEIHRHEDRDVKKNMTTTFAGVKFIVEGEEADEREEEKLREDAEPPSPPRPRPVSKPSAKRAPILRKRREDDELSIPCGRSLSSALSVIGGGLPLRRGGSDAVSATGGERAASSVHSPSTTTTCGIHSAGEVEIDAWEERIEEGERALSVTRSTWHYEAVVSEAGASDGRVEAEGHLEVSQGPRLGILDDGLEEEEGETELAARLRAETAQRVGGLSVEKRAALERVRIALYGPDVDPRRVAAVDQLVVCGDRDAMILSFLARKDFDADTALRSFDRVIRWRMAQDIEEVFEGERLARRKVEKHRACWPTAFYFSQDHAGDPIFVDRMGLLELARLRTGPEALGLTDMITYYIQTMEGRRRLLFPHLSRRSGRLISQYVSVVDVKHFGPQHFGRHALQFMRSLGDVHDENYSDLVKSLYIINAPFFFHKVFHLISCMMSQELKDRLKVLNKRESLRELSQILPPDLARRIVEGDPAGEREGERELHAFLDRAAREGLHRRRWV